MEKSNVPPQYRAKVTPFLGGYVKNTKLLVGDKLSEGSSLNYIKKTPSI